MFKIIKSANGPHGRYSVELEIEKNFTFPAGEVGVQLKTTQFSYFTTKAPYQTIWAQIQNGDDVMRLLNIVDALRRIDKTPIRLFLPYLPYSRQDRVCNDGESFALGVFAKLINSLNFERVTIADPHSDVSTALIENVEVLNQVDIINEFITFSNRILNSFKFVAPDAGSNKKIAKLASYFAHHDFIRADKLRNLDTGEIKETIVYADNLTGQNIAIVDDICDGGRTFIELAKVLKAKGAERVILFVTHGIFSKGFGPLLENGIDEIYTTNSYKNIDLKDTENVYILDLERVFVKNIK